MKNNNESKLKRFYNNFKKIWAVPQKKAGIKLLAYFIFFALFFLIAGIISRINNFDEIYINDTTTTQIVREDKYIDKQNKIINNKQNINYLVNINNTEYKINGTLENGIIDGYLETNEFIKKIVIENNMIYEIKNNTKIELNLDINSNILNIENILNKIKDNKTIIERIDENTNYFYTIELENKETNVKVFTNENDIFKIELFNDNNKYVFNFDS